MELRKCKKIAVKYIYIYICVKLEFCSRISDFVLISHLTFAQSAKGKNYFLRRKRHVRVVHNTERNI
jgi:hypothetical protein